VTEHDNQDALLERVRALPGVESAAFAKMEDSPEGYPQTPPYKWALKERDSVYNPTCWDLPM
jgi:hypothetical protein